MGGSPQLWREPGETEQEYIIRLQAEITRLNTQPIDPGDPRITNGSGNQDPGPQADKASRSDKKHDNFWHRLQTKWDAVVKEVRISSFARACA